MLDFKINKRTFATSVEYQKNYFVEKYDLKFLIVIC